MTTTTTGSSAEVSNPPVGADVETAQKVNGDRSSYGQILKSSTLVGGSSVVNTGIGIVRTKAMAVLLGPAGFGLFGLYTSIINLTQSIAGMGLNSSGVRQIAAAVGSDDSQRIAHTTYVLRRTCVVMGMLGALVLVIFSRQVSAMTFGTPARAGTICLLSLAALLQEISGGQGALIQGMRRIADLAKMSVLGALFGTLISVPMVYFFRADGVVPSLIGIAVTAILTSWWYSRKIHIQNPSLNFSDVGREAAALLKLGFAFMSSGLVAMGLAYAVRVFVLRTAGYAAAGYYQAAWTLGGLYVGIILQSMAADFYPRLTAAAEDNAECNRLVNEQALVGLLLAGPGIMATITFAPLAIALFYSSGFGAAVGILRWICLGATLQVLTWPMGFIVMAKGKAALLVFCEVTWGVVALGLAWISLKWFGLNGAGIAFFLSYVFHGILIYPVVRRLSGFSWSPVNRRTCFLYGALIFVVFGGFWLLPVIWAYLIGVSAAIVCGLYSLRVLCKLIPPQDIPRPVRRLLVKMGFALVGGEHGDGVMPGYSTSPVK